MAKGIRGTSMQGGGMTPAARRRRDKRLRQEEKRWAAMAGPVTVTFVDPKPKKDG